MLCSVIVGCERANWLVPSEEETKIGMLSHVDATNSSSSSTSSSNNDNKIEQTLPFRPFFSCDSGTSNGWDRMTNFHRSRNQSIRVVSLVQFRFLFTTASALLPSVPSLLIEQSKQRNPQPVPYLALMHCDHSSPIAGTLPPPPPLPPTPPIVPCPPPPPIVEDPNLAVTYARVNDNAITNSDRKNAGIIVRT